MGTDVEVRKSPNCMLKCLPDIAAFTNNIIPLGNIFREYFESFYNSDKRPSRIKIESTVNLMDWKKHYNGSRRCKIVPKFRNGLERV